MNKKITKIIELKKPEVHHERTKGSSRKRVKGNSSLHLWPDGNKYEIFGNSPEKKKKDFQTDGFNLHYL